MTKQERLHWFYTALLVIFIGTFHVLAGVNIAVRVAEKRARVVATQVVKNQIQIYDSVKTRKNEIQFDTIINRLNGLKGQVNARTSK